MQIIPVAESHDQEMSVFMAGQRVTLRLRCNVSTDRWSVDLSRDDEPILHGRRVLTRVDALEPFDFGLGSLFFHATQDDAVPNYDNVVAGIVELIHVEPGEVA